MTQPSIHFKRNDGKITCIIKIPSPKDTTPDNFGFKFQSIPRLKLLYSFFEAYTPLKSFGPL